MNTDRRTFLAQTSSAFALASLSGLGAAQALFTAATAEASEKKSAGPAASDDKKKAFLKAAADCMQTGDLCVAHCAAELAAGNTEMAKCNTSVQSMMAVCHASMKLVSLESSQAKKMVELCAAVCKDCAEACAEHKPHFSHGMHLACKDCMEACEAMAKACKAYLA